MLGMIGMSSTSVIQKFHCVAGARPFFLLNGKANIKGIEFQNTFSRGISLHLQTYVTLDQSPHLSSRTHIFAQAEKSACTKGIKGLGFDISEAESMLHIIHLE